MLGLENIAELFNLIDDDNARCEFWAGDIRLFSARYARPKSPTNILMKIDLTEFEQYEMFEME